MPFELPDNLHPDCGPVAWLLGTWRGNGHGDYPTIEPFQFGQELIFTHDGRPFFHYMARAWIVDEKGEKVRDAAIETGFLRAAARGQASRSCSPTTPASWRSGTAPPSGGKLEITTDAVARTETAKEYVGGKRLYGNVEGDLLYAYDMAAMGQALQPHTLGAAASAALSDRVDDNRHDRGLASEAPGQRLPADSAAGADPPRRRRARARHARRGPRPRSTSSPRRSTSRRSTARWRCSRSSAWSGTPTSATAPRRTTRSPTTSTSTWSAGIATASSRLTLMCSRRCATRSVADHALRRRRGAPDRLRHAVRSCEITTEPPARPARRRRRRRHRRAASPRTTARSTASSAPSRRATASSTSPTATCCGSSGPDRLTWLHSLTSQYFAALAPGTWTAALVLSPQGHVEHAFVRLRRRRGVHRPHRARPGRGAGRVPRPDAFMMRVEVADVTADLAVTWRPARRRSDGRRTRGYELVPRDQLDGVRRGRRPGLRLVGVRGAADRPRRAAARPGHRPPHDPQRGRLDRRRPCTSTRAATAARRPSRGCTPSAGRRAG